MTMRHNLMKLLQQHLHSREQSRYRKRQYHPIFKVTVSLLIFGACIAYRLLLPKIDVNCIRDTYHNLTQSLNRQMVLYPQEGSAYEGNSNPLSTTGQALIGIGQVIMDFWITTMSGLWTWKAKNGRVLVSVGTFYLIRSLLFLNVELFPFPQNLVWRSPGFFSLTVPYDHTRDFFYSGHTGSLTLIFLELFTLKQYLLCFLVGLSWIFMINMLLITKVHYMADIVGGLVFAVWFFWMGSKIVFYFDKFLSFPYFLINWIYKNKCKEQKQESILPRQTTNRNQNRPNNDENEENPGTSKLMNISSIKPPSK